jgi:pre-rRNA-processing protein TSR3
MASESRSRILILQHYKENLRKCSLSHLRGHSNVEFKKLHPVRPAPQFPDLRGVVLALGAPQLRADDAALLDDLRPKSQLILLDSTWAKVDRLLRNIGGPGGDQVVDEDLIRSGGADGLYFRSLPDNILTAYPRRSKLYDDPGSGLASVEALVVAFEILRAPMHELLDGYRWGQEFLDVNPAFF